MEENSEKTQTPDGHPTETPPLIYAPRSPWLEFILTFFTFGLSSPFWLVARVEDTQILSGKKFKLWLWFFVPLNPLFQLIAFPRLFKAMDSIHAGTQNKKQIGWKALFLVLIVSTTIISSIGSVIELPDWTLLPIFLLYSLAIAILQSRFNLIKRGVKGFYLTKIKSVYKVWEWILLVIIAPIGLIGFYVILEPFFAESEDIPKNTTLAYPDQPFQLTIAGEGWRKVEIGTHSEGSAELELSGPQLNTFYIVFKHGLDDSLNSISYFRQNLLLDDNTDTTCKHSREFAGDDFKVSALVICEGKSFRIPILTISKTIQTDQGIFEISGSYSNEESFFNKHKDSFIAIAKGFKAK